MKKVKLNFATAMNLLEPLNAKQQCQIKGGESGNKARSKLEVQ